MVVSRNPKADMPDHLLTVFRRGSSVMSLTSKAPVSGGSTFAQAALYASGLAEARSSIILSNVSLTSMVSWIFLDPCCAKTKSMSRTVLPSAIHIPGLTFMAEPNDSTSVINKSLQSSKSEKSCEPRKTEIAEHMGTCRSAGARLCLV